MVEEAKRAARANQNDAGLAFVLQTFLVGSVEHLARARSDLETAGKEGRPTIDGEKRIEPLDVPYQVLEVGPVVLQGEDHFVAAEFVEEEGCLRIEDIEG